MNRSTLMAEYQDISQRLEYLVAHSSQMVFVTGEDMAIQKGFVEAFLGQQSKHANVAFLGAKKGKKVDYYRQLLAEQLGFENLNQHQSLVQSFGSRSDKTTPVLIAVTNAELMTQDMLRELWDLVLQNRFARTSEQINILVFGEQSWAEEVKAWLPTNNNDKPVLLTTQTLEYEEEHEVEGDLEEMIANRRKLFQERLKARSLNYYGETPVLKAWWFRLLTACFFVVSFSAILIWQYFDVTSTAAREFAQFLFQSEVVETQQPPKQENEVNQSEIDENIAGLAATGIALTKIQGVDTSGTDTNSQNTSNARIPAKLDLSDAPRNSRDENARASTSFAAALSALDGPTPPVLDGEQGNTVTARPSPDQAMQEYVADISTEQLKQLRARTEGASSVSDGQALALGATEIASPQESYEALSRSLAQEAQTMRAEQGRTARDINNALQPNQGTVAKTPDLALDAAINAALEVVEGLQANAQNAANTPAIENTQIQQENQDQQENQVQETALSNALNTEVASAEVLVEALPEDVAPIELTSEVNEETILMGGEVDDYPVADIVTEAQALAQSANSQVANADVTQQENVAEIDAAQIEQDQTNIGFTPQEQNITNLQSTAELAETQVTTDATESTLSDRVDAQQDTNNVISALTITGPNYIYNEASLVNRPSNHYVLQISGVSTPDLLRDYLQDNNLAQNTWVYHTQRYGGDWFVVLFNQSYPTLDEARRSVAQVTRLLPNSQPFVKSMEQVQQEIAINTP